MRPSPDEHKPTSDHIPRPREPIGDVARLATLSHELSNLLDGSMRWLELAKRDIRSGTSELGHADLATKRLDVVAQSLERMAGLIDGAMRDASRAIGKPGGPVQQYTLAESARHAVDVLMPRADAEEITLSLTIDREAMELPTGPLYTPILNGVRNAMDSVWRTGEAGFVAIEITRERRKGVDHVRVRVTDNGVGLGGEFEPRAGGMGIGLALSTTIIEHSGGSLRLSAVEEESDRGAILEFWCPVSSLIARTPGLLA